jgi:hypothetical protein
MKPIMVIESIWKTPRKPMTPHEEEVYEHWCNEIHIPDLLRGTGMVSVTRYKNKDGSGYLWIQEFESEAALQKYLVSERRKELIHETESHYPGGDAPKNLFGKRSVRCFDYVAGESIG